jgi:hypothetical protein
LVRKKNGGDELISQKVVELYGTSTGAPGVNWPELISGQQCPFLEKKCLKNRKSEPEKTIGTCVVNHSQKPVIICPHRLLERQAIFRDCIHLLTKHEPGNDFHCVPEIKIPGGNVDYFLVSSRKGKVADFIGIELQTLDTTGTVYPERQRFVHSVGVTDVSQSDLDSTKPYGMNWKMTAKTILVQLHHKVSTFEHLNKTLVLVLQDHLLDYMRKEFSFDHIEKPTLANPMHFHSYEIDQQGSEWSIQLSDRLSTDTDGIAVCLGLQAEASVELAEIVAALESKMSKDTLISL